MCIYHNNQSINRSLVWQAVHRQENSYSTKEGPRWGTAEGAPQPPSPHLQMTPSVPRKQHPHIPRVAEIPKATHPLSARLWIFKSMRRVVTFFWVNTCSQGEMTQYITRQRGWEKQQSWPDTLFLENSSTVQIINLFCKSQQRAYFEIVILECILVYIHTGLLFFFFSFKVYPFWPSYSPSGNPPSRK